MQAVTWQGEIKVADRIKVANQLTLRWEDYPGLSRWVHCNRKGLNGVGGGGGKAGGAESESVM